MNDVTPTDDAIVLDAIFNKHYKDGALTIIEKVVATFSEKYSDQFITERLAKTKQYRKQLRKLMKIPTIEQRSPEWYEVRNNLITASDMGQALGVGKFGSVRDLYVKKSAYEDVPFGTFPALEWGVRFEAVATRIYEKRQNAHINEFGLIQHSNILFYGASPDGITDNGVMLEIKCPYKRKIDGKIVDQYYYQMQGQLEVCDLDECDFLECSFHEYFDEVDYDADWNKTKTMSADDTEKGIIIVVGENSEGLKYLYSEAGDTRANLKKWLKAQEHITDKYNHQIKYYKLKLYNVQKVIRNKDFFTEKIKLLKDVWNTILRYRSDRNAYDIEIGKREVKKRPVKCLFVADNEC
jgi:putative phage-type endonuclease